MRSTVLPRSVGDVRAGVQDGTIAGPTNRRVVSRLDTRPIDQPMRSRHLVRRDGRAEEPTPDDAGVDAYPPIRHQPQPQPRSLLTWLRSFGTQ